VCKKITPGASAFEYLRTTAIKKLPIQSIYIVLGDVKNNG
jgi:hypothetical protein